MNTLHYRLALTFICFYFLAYCNAQKITGFSGGEKLEEASLIFFNQEESPKQLSSILAEELERDPFYGFSPKGKINLVQRGLANQRYMQTINGREVYGSSVSVQSERGKLTSMSGRLIKGNPNSNAAAIGFVQALGLACDHINADIYMWEAPELESFIKMEMNDDQATFYPEEKLVYFPSNFPSLDGELVLAYVIDIYALNPISKQDVIIDASSGEVLFTNGHIHTIDTPGTAETSYSGNQAINTFQPSVGSNYELTDMSRGSGIFTYDCNNNDSYTAAVIPTSAANDWDFGNPTDNAILDAHWGTEQTYDYFDITHNWQSYDNNDSPMRSYVHFDLISFGYSNNNNAFWDGSRMTYGDGDGIVFNPLTAIDVVGHEITHGVTENSANLIYSDESGALNESFSDIFGACVEYYAKPSDFSWFLGDEMAVAGNPLRNMANPKSLGNPDTYAGDFWVNGGSVHNNSGVQNYWFYLLSDGGTGTNDIGDDYNVSGIGISTAQLIAWRTLTVYLNQSSNYADARIFSIQSAQDLFGDCSPELIATTNAWHAVGVGGLYDEAVIADFSSSATYSCSVPGNISFSNNSVNAATYLWDFGDGSTSTELDPIHSYLTAGVYDVSLTVTGTSLCNSTDTYTLSSSIVIENITSFPVALCAPSAIFGNNGSGIAQVTFEEIESSSDNSDVGYEDFSCSYLVPVMEGMPYAMNLSLYQEGFVKVWIDGNNDGEFSSSEMAYSSLDDQQFHEFDLIIPAVTTYNTPVRMRVVSSEQEITSSCDIGITGQVEDYAVEISDNTNPPEAAFTASSVNLIVGETVSFSDLSLNAPVTWEWSFPGADVISSIEQNVSVTYSSLGAYDVELLVTNEHGSDVLVLPNYINVISTFNMCDVEVTNATSGTFYDPGGPTGNYGNNNFCTLLIQPACAESITLDFEAFLTEGGFDPIRIYDGNSTSNPILGTFSGSSTPPPVTSSGGEMFIVWDTDGSVTTSGFEVNWTSVISSSLPITAEASSDNDNPAFGVGVQFNDLTLEDPVEWLWDFGDGNTSNLQNPIHVYLSPGVQEVVLTVSNCTFSDTDTIYVEVDQPPGIIIDPFEVDLVFPNCEDSLSTSLWIYNTGDGNLEYFNSGSELFDDFEGASIDSDIFESSSGEIATGCGAFSGNTALYFGTNEGIIRQLTTVPLTLLSTSEISFMMRYGSAGGTCETVDFGENVVSEYSIDGGFTYNLIESYVNIFEFSSFTEVVISIPSDAVGVPTRYRLRQLDHQTNFDQWSIDDFRVTGNSGVANMIPDSGIIPPGDSIMVELIVYRLDALEGMYNTNYVLLNNTLSAPVFNIDINYEIQGEGILGLPDACLELPTIQQGTSFQDTIYIQNSGCADIILGSLSNDFGELDFILESSILPPNDSVYVALDYNPIDFGPWLDTLSFTYDGIDTTLCLEGLVLGAPIINVLPNPAEVLFPNCEDSITTDVWMYNTGNGVLQYFDGGSQLFDDFEGTALNPDLFEQSTGLIAEGCGAFSGNTALFFNSSFGVRQVTTVPLALTSQASITFMMNYGTGGGLCEQLDFGENVVSEYSTDGINYNLIESYSDIFDYGNYTQVEIPIPADAVGVPTRYRLRQLSFGNGIDTWSIDDFTVTGNDGIVSISPEVGAIPSGDSTLVSLTIQRSDLVEGFYTTSFDIANNSPGSPMYIIDVNYEIQGEGVLEMPDACLELPVIQQGTSFQDTLYLKNTGCADILLGSLTNDYQDLDFNLENVIIPTNDSVYIAYDFNPIDFGLVLDTLSFTYDGIDTSLCIEALVLGAPIISALPNPIEVLFPNCEDSITTDVWMYNTGNGVLQYFDGGSQLFDDFEGTALNPDLFEQSTGLIAPGCGAFSGNTALFFNSSFGVRQVTTVPLALTSQASITFMMNYGTTGVCEQLDFGENVVSEYSTDGITYNLIESYSDNFLYFNNYTEIEIPIPADAVGVPTRYRLRQLSFGNGIDTWSIDDFTVTGNDGLISISPETGLIGSGDSTLVSLTILRSNFPEGSYSNAYVVSSNSPGAPLYTIDVNYEIQGDGILGLPEACLELPTIQQWTSFQDTIYLQNTGCADIILGSLTNQYEDLDFELENNIIPPNDSVFVVYDFNPIDFGAVLDTLSFTYDGIDTTLCIEGTVLGAPIISVLPNPVDVLFPNCEDSITTSVWIYNTGNGDLEYNASGTQLFEDFEGNTINPDIFESNSGEIAIGCGAFSGNTALYFNTNSGITRQVTTQPIELGSLGVISFMMRYGSTSGGTCELVDFGENIVAEYSTDGFTFNLIESYSDIPSFFEFSEVIIPVPADAVGVPTRYRLRQLDHQSNFDQWSIDDFSVSGNNETVNISPDTGIVPFGDSLLVDLTIYRADLTEGLYTASYDIANNSPSAPNYTIDVNFEIQGDGILNLPNSCLELPAIPQGTSLQDTIYIENTGCSNIILGSLSNDIEDLYFTLENSIIPPNDSVYVAYEFNPSGFGIVLDTLAFTYDGIDTTLCIEALVLGAPIINVLPNPVNVLFPNCEDSITTSVWIYNEGNANLEYLDGGSELLDDFEGSVINPNLFEFSSGEITTGCGAFSGNTALFFGTAGGTRQITTVPLTLSNSANITFMMNYGTTGVCEQLDNGENVVSEYSTDGVTYSLIESYSNIFDYSDFTEVIIPVPADAVGVPTRYRLRQLSFGSGIDTWTIDDFAVTGNDALLSMSPESGVIAPGDSTLVQLTIQRNGFIEGFYNSVYSISSNSPAEPLFDLDINYEIQGEGQVSYQSSCLEFSQIQENTSITDSVLIRNTGCSEIVLSNFITNEVNFTVFQGSVIMAAADSLWVSIEFAPTSFGIHQGDLLFDSNGMPQSICLEGLADGSAAIQVIPNPLVLFSDGCTGSISGTVEILNTGNAPLAWDQQTLSNLETFESPFLDSDIWTSNGSNGTLCSPFEGAQSHFFNGNTQRVITSIPLTVDANTELTFELYYASGSGSCEQLDAGEFVVVEYATGGTGWTTLEAFSNLTQFQNWSQVTVTFPVLAYGDDTALRIRQVDDSGQGTDVWGIDNLGLNSSNPEGIALVPEQGLVPVGGSSEVNFTIDISDIDSGQFVDQIIINTNDPLNPQVTVPVIVNIFGFGLLEYIGIGCVEFSDTESGLTSTALVEIQNTGCNPLTLTSAALTGPFNWDFEPLELEPNEISILTVEFSPLTSGLYTGSLVLESLGGQVEICLEGEAFGSPELQVNTDPIQLDFEECEEVLFQTVTVTNTGFGILNFDFGVTSPYVLGIIPSFGSLSASESVEVTVSFISNESAPGSYVTELVLNSNDDTTPEVVIPVNLNVPNIGCPNFDYLVSGVCGSTFQFENLSYNDNGNYTWDFGDGSPTTSLENPLHTFAESGTYLVTLTTGTGLLSNTYTEEVTIESIFVSFLNSEMNSQGEVDFASTTPNALSWSWNFGDGSTGEGEQVTHIYALNGTYDVTLTVENLDGCIGSQTETLEFLVGLQELDQNVQIELYPNPVGGELFIKTSGISIESLVINDALGRKVLQVSKEGSNLERIDVTDIPPGTYIAVVHTERGTKRIRFVKR